ncbi:MAG: hypothetical protein RIQ47_1438 [Bacteroidota bacterium]|jgi:hypothetical protein
MKTLKKWSSVVGVVLFFTIALSLSSVNAAVKIAYWNLLNWPNASSLVTDTTTRCPMFRAVMDVVRPDILVTGENQSTQSVPYFLQQVLNANGSNYRQGVYIQGVDSNNGIFFLDSLFAFVSNVPIRTTLRDISQFTLIYKPTGDTLRIYAVHLKAATGSTNEAQRAQEVDSLRKVTNALPAGTDFIVCGDFNIYGDYESAYQKLVVDNTWNDGHFVDPISITGVWNNPSYSFYHTQSTRSTSVGGGAGGGLDDRFDMILNSSAVAQSGGMYYVPGSCQPFGNDGNHFSRSINFGTNTAVSAAVANALYGASDHLPIVAEYDFGTNPGIEETYLEKAITVFPNPSSGRFTVRLEGGKHISSWRLIDGKGALVDAQIVADLVFENAELLEIAPEKSLLPGIYGLLLNVDNIQIIKHIYIY